MEKNTMLRLRQVLQKVPVAPSTWWRWVAEGKAPRGVKIGPRVTAWRGEDIDKFIESRGCEA